MPLDWDWEKPRQTLSDPTPRLGAKIRTSANDGDDKICFLKANSTCSDAESHRSYNGYAAKGKVSDNALLASSHKLGILMRLPLVFILNALADTITVHQSHKFQLL